MARLFSVMVVQCGIGVEWIYAGDPFQTQLLDCCVCLNEGCEVGGFLYPVLQ
jgi:hypothetical protein